MSVSPLIHARDLYGAGRHAEAAHALEAHIADGGDGAETSALLAWCYEALGRGADCERALARSLAQDGSNRAALVLSMQRAERSRDFVAALARAQALADLDATSAAARFNLGVLQLHAGAPQAADSLAAALVLDPRFVPARTALAQLHFDRGEYQAAAAHWQAAIGLVPSDHAAWIGLGLAQLRRHAAAAAREAFERATALAPHEPQAWRGFAEAAELEGDQAATLAARARELALARDSVDAHIQASLCLSRLGFDASARGAAARAGQLAPERLLARWLQWQMLPLVYANAAEIERWREHWRKGLAEFERVDLAPDHVAAQLPELLASLPNFFLHYTGGILLDEQRRYGALIERMARRCWPRAGAERAPRKVGRLRIGFASAHLRSHTIWKLFHGWFARLDRARFEPVAIYLGSHVDDTVRGLAGEAEQVIGPHYSIDAWLGALHDAELDALVWLDVGMDGATQQLSALRFAPVQCVAWGHPLSSGLRQIDYFLSGAAMEPPAGEAHYAERLVRLPGLGIAYDFPARARALGHRARGAQAPVFLCAQSVYKITPAHYDLFARIAELIPHARFELCPHPTAEVRERLANGFRRAFAARGRDFDACAHMHPLLSQDEFFDALRRADVLLDTLAWSGGNTTLEALATGLPVVTLPGETMRSRHSFAMLELMGIEHELAARDADHYVAIAVRLAQDHEFHARMVAAIEQRRGVLFEDPKPVRALEEFLWHACGRK